MVIHPNPNLNLSIFSCSDKSASRDHWIISCSSSYKKSFYVTAEYVLMQVNLKAIFFVQFMAQN